MKLENSLIKLQRALNQGWQAQDSKVLSQNEFDYLDCIFEAESKEPSHDLSYQMEHDDSSHLSAVAEQMQVRKSSASLMINKLEKRGFIERVTCRYDARAQHILLTELGRDVYNKTRQAVYGQLASELKRELSEQEVATLKQITQLIGECGYGDC